MKRVLMSILMVTAILGLLVSGISCTKTVTQIVYVTPSPTTAAPSPTPTPTPAPTPTPTPRPTATLTPVPTPVPVGQQIIITYSATTMTQIGTGYMADTPKAGYVYLVLNMTIQNQGYDSFSVNPFYFSVVVSNVKYHTAFVTELDNELGWADVMNGGSMSGNLAFEVPSSVTYSGFHPTYEAFLTTYNIQWSGQ